MTENEQDRVDKLFELFTIQDSINKDVVEQFSILQKLLAKIALELEKLKEN